MKTTTFRNAAAPQLFASVRGSRDLSLYAFAGALLTALALHTGAFIPRMASSETRHEAPQAIQAAMPAAASASMSTEGPHSNVRPLRDATYLVASFSGRAPGLSEACGQYAAKMS